MEFTLNVCEELLDRFEQITESVDVITERIGATDSVDTLMETPWGMTTLDSCVMRLQVIGELVRAIDRPAASCLPSIRPSRGRRSSACAISFRTSTRTSTTT